MRYVSELSGLLLVVALQPAHVLGQDRDLGQIITVSPETTHITAPLTKDGLPDYDVALNEYFGKGVTSENNANVLIWKAFGPIPEGIERPVSYFEMMGMEPPPVEGNYLVGIAIDSIVNEADIVFLKTVRPMREQIAQYYKDIQSLPRLPVMADKVDRAERYCFLDTVLLVIRGGPNALNSIAGGDDPNALEQTIMKMVFNTVDWNIVLKIGNDWYDRQVAVMREPDYETRQLKLEEFEVEMREMAARYQGIGAIVTDIGKRRNVVATISNIVGAAMVSLMMPALASAQQAEDRARQQDRNLSVAFAMALYHAEHNTYPQQLDELAEANSQRIGGILPPRCWFPFSRRQDAADTFC